MRIQGSGFTVHGSAVGIVGAALLAGLLAAGCGPATPKKEFQAGVALLQKGDLAEGKARLEAALD